MASPKLLITGATGFIGFEILLHALEAGYTVRAAVRSASKSEFILSNPTIKALAPGDKLSFIEVPDILADDAYGEALDGVTYAIHIASPLPLPNKDPERDVYLPGIKGTTNILNAALKSSSVKRMVITSSIVSNMPLPPPTETITTAESRLPTPKGPFTGVFPAYSASKIYTLNLTDNLVKQKNPSFDIINVIPGFVYGRDKRAADTTGLLTGSNRALLLSILGQHAETPRLAGAAHVNDVAKVHLLALDEKIPGGQNFGVTRPVVYDDAYGIVKKHCPKAIEDGVFTQGSQPSVAVKWDASKTEKSFGFKFQTFEDMVVDVAKQYLELSIKA